MYLALRKVHLNVPKNPADFEMLKEFTIEFAPFREGANKSLI